MSASRDWVGMEAAVCQLLPSSGVTSARAQLLAQLADYSAAATREARTLGAIVPSSAECAQALEWLLRPVFICGHQRSGTTLVQSMLDGHPQLLSLPSEGTYFSSFAYMARRASSDRDMDRFAAEWITRFVDPNFEPHFRLGRSVASRSPAVDFARMLFGWNEALRRQVPQELAPLLALAAAFRATAAPASAPQQWVEKTPQNERHVARFAFFGAARFIQLVRDPRAMLASLNEIYRTHGRGFDAAEHAQAIGRSLRLAQQNSRRFGDRYLVLRYEDLVDRPAQEIRGVQQFLGIASDATLLVPTAGGRAVRANSSFGKRAAGIIEPSRPPTVLPAEHEALLGVYVAHTARPFGYELAAPGSIARYAIRLRHWPRHLLRESRTRLRAAHLRYG
jgi:hypothetical protein